MPHHELNEAVNRGDADAIQQLLPQLRQDQVDGWLCGSILRAAYENRASGVRALLDVRASADAVDGLGQTPLHWAARQGHEAIARLLAERGASSRMQNQEGVTPLHLAAELNAGAIVQLLLAHRADPSIMSNDKRTALHAAADHGSAVALAVLLEAKSEDFGNSGGAALELENERGETPLARAAVRGHAAVVQLLLRAKADTGHRNWWGQGPLHLAAYGGHVGAAAVLLDGSADTSLQAQDGSTALHTAAERGNAQVLELLLSHGANPGACAAGGRTALHAAAERGCAEAVEALLAHGAAPDVRTDEARTPLSFAASRGHVLVAKRLLEHRADPQALDNTMQTPLHAAAAAGRAEAADLLLQRRARIEQKDAAGRTPIALAIAARQEASVRLLLKRGAAVPEDLANTPDMQQFLRQVEAEALQEQLREAEEGRCLVKIQAAEQELEDVRLKLLALAALSCASSTAPVIHQAEIQLADALEAAKLKKQVADNLLEQVKQVKLALADVNAEVGEKNRTLQAVQKSIDALRDARSRKGDELVTLKRNLADAQTGLRISGGKEGPLETQAVEARLKLEAVEAQLAALNEDADGTLAELLEVRQKLAEWNAAKEEAAALHWKAHSLLNRGAKLPGSP